jgi:hypothetical protein
LTSAKQFNQKTPNKRHQRKDINEKTSTKRHQRTWALMTAKPSTFSSIWPAADSPAAPPSQAVSASRLSDVPALTAAP